MATDIIARGMITEYIAGTNINFTENRDGTVEISASGSISSEDSVARDAIGNHKSDTSNPHNVTPAQIGLGNVDNTSDLDKPISTAVQKAIDNKADKTTATTDTDGLMSAEDKGKLDAFEITTTGGKLHDKNIVTDDMSLPANGGNADTVDGLHAADFANAYNDYLDTYLVGKSGDIRELAYLLPTGGLWANTKFPELENITFPIEGDILITWDKSKYIQYGYIYGVLTIRPMTSTGDTYICSVYNTTSYTDWQKISDGGNADTLDGLHADDFVNANDRHQIQIPNNVDVPVWIHTYGKRFQRYTTNSGNIGLTNVPDNSTDYVWYWYDGMNIIARVYAVSKYYICDMINGNFSGWKDVYTSRNKPYVTGYVPISEDGKCYTNHGFTPSVILYNVPYTTTTLKDNVYKSTKFDTTSFTPFSGASGSSINYIIFR